jgi:hypothetical protein
MVKVILELFCNCFFQVINSVFGKTGNFNGKDITTLVPSNVELNPNFFSHDEAISPSRLVRRTNSDSGVPAIHCVLDLAMSLDGQLKDIVVVAMICFAWLQAIAVVALVAGAVRGSLLW